MMQITEKERRYLRELAKKQKEYANLPEMERKKQRWFDLNMGKTVVPPVVVETWTFDPDMMPESIYQCTTPRARQVEYSLLKNIREYELIHDDKVVPDYYPVGFQVLVDEFGVPVEEHHASGEDQRRIGYEYKSPIQDLEEDFHLLKPSTVEIRRKETEQEKEFMQELLGDILPVEIETGLPNIAMPFQMSKLLGLQGMMVALYDCPEAVHRLMEYLTENQIRVMKTFEDAGILTMNNRNHGLGVSSYSFTDELAKGPEGKVRLKDLWMWAEAEETASISPEQFREFFLPYMARAAKEMGLIYYGCCEPMQRILTDVLKAIPNIRKVSVSPFSDQKKVGEQLKGTGIVFSRKPSANYLSIDSSFQEEAWKAHISETLEAARGCQCEIIMRDIYQVADLANVRRAVEIAQELAEGHR